MRYNLSLFSSTILFFFFATYQLNAQEQLGLKLENYSGINSVLFNPTYSVTSPFRWDVNLISAGVFMDNNYAYIRNASVIDVLRNSGDIQSQPDINPELPTPNSPLILDYDSGNNKKQASLLVTVMGPSAMLNLRSGWSVGLFTNARVATSARKIPSSLNYYQFDDQDFNTNISVDPFKVAGMVWSEVGFNVAKQFPTQAGTLALGFNLKFLNGHEAFYIDNKSSFDVSKLNTDTLSFQSIDLEYAYTSSNVNQSGTNFRRNGSGVGLDLGFSYIEGDIHDYRWKAGVALVDLGRIRFFNNASQHTINLSTDFEVDVNELENADNVTEQSELISLETLGDRLASETDTDFNIATPAALTAYGDYRLLDKVYVNASLVQSLSMGNHAIARDNQLAITPRYEHRWFGAMLPVSLLNYRKLRVGLSARLAFITIGTEDLTSFIKQDQLSGTDFYVGIKINPFNVNLPGKRNRRGNVRCYDF